jgi:hypothetical protein
MWSAATSASHVATHKKESEGQYAKQIKDTPADEVLGM